MKRLLPVVFFFSFVGLGAIAQKTIMPVSGVASPERHVLTWKAPMETPVSETETVKSLFFEGASYDENRLPVFYKSIPITSGNSATAHIENAVYEALAETD